MEASLNIFVNKLLAEAAKSKASNIHLAVGSYPSLRIDEELVELQNETIITDGFMRKLADAWLDESHKKELADQKSVIFVKEVGKNFRVKFNFFFQKDFLSATLRVIPARIPPLINLGLPKSVYSLAEKTSGLVVVAGPFGSGRTTTIASMVEEINKSRKVNIVSVERPIEYLFVNQKSLIEQRQVGRDVNSFASALDYAQQSDVDVLALSATPEPEVLPLVLEFAASGRLTILHMDTNSAVQTIEEIFASFPEPERQRSQLLLSETLLAIIIQRLVPRAGGGLVLASEVLIATEAVRSLIREGRVKQITTILQSSRAEGMVTMDQSLALLVKSGDVLADQAASYSSNPESFRSLIKR